MELALMTRETFEPLQGETFAIRFGSDGGSVQGELIEVKGRGQGLKREAFSLLFKLPAETRWPQGLMEISHEALSLTAIFLVPVGPGEGGALYEAVFT